MEKIEKISKCKILKVTVVSLSGLNLLLRKNGYEGNYIKQKYEEKHPERYAISTVITDNVSLSVKLGEILGIKIVDMKWTNFPNEVEIKFE